MQVRSLVSKVAFPDKPSSVHIDWLSLLRMLGLLICHKTTYTIQLLPLTARIQILCKLNSININITFPACPH